MMSIAGFEFRLSPRSEWPAIGYRSTSVSEMQSGRGRDELAILLDLPEPRVLAYEPESVVAEKLHAIVKLGLRNSRIKDYYDIDYIASRFAFDGATLSEAIRRTFERRRTPVPHDVPIGLTIEYWRDLGRATQMLAFAKRARLELDEPSSDQLIDRLQGFLLPVLQSLAAEEVFHRTWEDGGPWR